MKLTLGILLGALIMAAGLIIKNLLTKKLK